MKQQILKKHNPIVIFLTNFTCHALVVIYCLVFLKLTSVLQSCFSALGTPSAFLLLGGTLSLYITRSWAPDTLQKSPLFPSMFCGSPQSQGFSSSTGMLFHNFLAQTTVIWVLPQCDITLPSPQVRLLRRASFDTPPNSQCSSCARAFLPLCGVFYENRVSQTQTAVLKQSVTKETWAISAYVFIPHLSCCNRLCNRIKVLPTITLTIHPDLQ